MVKESITPQRTQVRLKNESVAVALENRSIIPCFATLKVTYYTTRCECDLPLQAVLKICLF